jgi:hypothetical protein
MLCVLLGWPEIETEEEALVQGVAGISHGLDLLWRLSMNITCDTVIQERMKD